MQYSKLVVSLFFISGEMPHSPYLDASNRFDLRGAGHCIEVEAVCS